MRALLRPVWMPRESLAPAMKIFLYIIFRNPAENCFGQHSVFSSAPLKCFSGRASLLSATAALSDSGYRRFGAEE